MMQGPNNPGNLSNSAVKVADAQIASGLIRRASFSAEFKNVSAAAKKCLDIY